MFKSTVIRWILFALTFGGGAAVFAYFVYQEGLSNILASVGTFGLIPFCGFVVLSLLNFILYSWRWQVIINEHLPKEKRAPLHRMYMHRMGGYAVSYLTPAAQVGGEPVRIALLASDGVSGKDATSSVVLDVAFELSAYILFIIAGVVLALLEGLGDGQSFLIIAIGLGLTLAVLMLFFLSIANGKGFFVHLFRITQLHRWKRLHAFERNIVHTEELMSTFLRGRTSLLTLVATLSLAVIFFRVVEVLYLSYFFGVDLNFGQAFLVSTLPGIALLLPVPAGLGVFEGSFSALFGLLAIPLNAVAFALIIRSRDVIFIVLGVLHILSRGKAFVERKLVRAMQTPIYEKRS